MYSGFSFGALLASNGCDREDTQKQQHTNGVAHVHCLTRFQMLVIRLLVMNLRARHEFSGQLIFEPLLFRFNWDFSSVYRIKPEKMFFLLVFLFSLEKLADINQFSMIQRQ